MKQKAVLGTLMLCLCLDFSSFQCRSYPSRGENMRHDIITISKAEKN